MTQRSIASFLAAVINVGFYMVAVVLVVMSCLACLSFFVDLGGTHTELGIPVSFSVETGALRQIPAPPNIRNPDIRDAYGTLRFSPPSGIILTSTALLAALALGVVLYVLAQLRAVFRTVRDGHPFVTANAQRIRWIGYSVIFWEIAKSLVLFSGNAYAQTHFATDVLIFDPWPKFDVFAIIHGLIILVIAEVFRAGARLDEEQSLTI